MAEFVYFLCAITSMTCCGLLFRAYRRQRVALLLWSAVCFAGLALNNGLLFVDLVILPQSIDLSIVRTLPAFFGSCFLVYALAWEAA